MAYCKGAYGLLIRVAKRVELEVAGKKRVFKSGYYVYSGSAQNGLEKRLRRHCSRSLAAGSDGKNHWHVDCLMDVGKLLDFWILPAVNKTAECELAGIHAGWPGGESVDGFGAADCTCASHLVYFPRYPVQSILAPEVEERIDHIFSVLRCHYNNHALTQHDPLRSLFSCIISLRTRDSVTRAATARLFEKYRRVEDFAAADIEQISDLIYPAGMYRQKAGNMVRIAEILQQKFNSTVPDEIDQLVSLPGVGRKTANLVRGFAFDKPAICVDTHVHRITNRWGLVRSRKPDETEKELRRILPSRYWIEINPFLVQHGQQICRPGSPRCSECFLHHYCRYQSLVDEAELSRQINCSVGHPSLTRVFAG